MDWYEILGLPLIIISALWGGWKLWKHIPREVGEALLTIADAVDDDRISRREVQAITIRYIRVINAVAKALKR